MTGVSGGSINGNSAVQGGGLYVASGTVNILAGVGINKNTASLAGGGAYIAGGNVAIAGGTMASNTANNKNLNGNGGGIYANGGTLTLTGENIGPNNTAEVSGGGMYLAKASTTTFKNVTVSGNILGNGGGKGKGVAFENGATMNPKPLGPPALTDKDDPGGNPVQV